MPESSSPPTLSFVLDLVGKHYGFKGNLSPLAGEVDYNYRLRSENQQYTLKISRLDTELQEIEFQVAIMSHLKENNLPFEYPKIVTALNGAAYIDLGKGQFLRVQKWVGGKMLGDLSHRSERLLQSWGSSCGQLSLQLQSFDHPAAHRQYKWNPAETLASKPYQKYFQNEQEIALSNYFWQLFEAHALPHLKDLRRSINHNDAHELNLLVQSDQLAPTVTGIIDFGDALYCETISELAIACAYAGMGMPDPLAAMAQIVKGYHAVFPCEEKEIALLFPLITARLMITVANAAFNKYKEPENEYLLISERPAWELLKKLHQVPPPLAHYTFRSVCGWEPCPKRIIFNNWWKKKEASSAEVIDFKNKKVIPLDLSVGSLILGNNSEFDTIAAFEKMISRHLEDETADYGIGGYGEARPFYTTDAYVVKKNDGAQWRTVHLGTDIWCTAGTAVYAAFDGTVHSFANNAGDCNYGPTIILTHKVNDDLTFYTLYGHLSMDSIDQLKVGAVVKKGAQIGSVGTANINGNWPPHLHFQVLLDLLGMKGDFPGVAFPKEQNTWLSLCPPLRLAANFLPTSISHKKPQSDILASRKNNLGKGMSISYREPLHMVRAYKQYLYAADGRRYLDTVNNVPHVGHQHPRVVRAAQRQTAVLNTNTRYLNQQITDYAEALLETFPTELSVVHFVNSGSEANELALRMAKCFTGQKDMLAVEVGYHGNTNACIDVSSYKFDGKGGQGAPETTHIIPLPDTYRGLYRDPETASEKYAGHVGEVIDKLEKKNRKIAGFIGESILSCGGQIVLPPGYLTAVYEQVRAAGGICIADEVQVGFGRVGEHFWGFELQGVVPDIVVLGKPIGNGHPLAAVVCTEEVAQAFANGMEFFNTFGGNPVSCAIGHEVLKVVQEEGLQAHAKATGDYLKAGLKVLQDRFEMIGDVRGHGLFLGFELVKNRETKTPAPEWTSYLANRMRERGILMSTDGPDHNVIKIKPPLCFTKENADYLLEELEAVFRELE